MTATPPSLRVAIRPARPDEAPELAELMERTFRATYSGNSTASELEKFVAAHFGPEQQRRELADPRLVTLVAAVATADEAIPTAVPTAIPAPAPAEAAAPSLVAFAQVRPDSGRATPPCVAARRPAELSRFYVDHAWHGRGVAGSLMEACVATAAGAGADALWLMVYRINARAIAFYRKQGFAPVGTAPFRFGDEVHEDVVMARPLSPG